MCLFNETLMLVLIIGGKSHTNKSLGAMDDVHKVMGKHLKFQIWLVQLTKITS